MECMEDPIFKALYQGELSWGNTITEKDDEEMLTAWKTAQGDLIHKRIMTKMGQIQLNKLFPNMFPNMVLSDDEASNNGIKTLIIRNLPRDIHLEELRRLFQMYGTVSDIYIPRNMNKTSPYFGSIKGFAIIKYSSADESKKAFHALLNRLAIRGNPIQVEFAKEDR